MFSVTTIVLILNRVNKVYFRLVVNMRESSCRHKAYKRIEGLEDLVAMTERKSNDSDARFKYSAAVDEVNCCMTANSTGSISS